jgi:hypothetical protein
MHSFHHVRLRTVGRVNTNLILQTCFVPTSFRTRTCKMGTLKIQGFNYVTQVQSRHANLLLLIYSISQCRNLGFLHSWRPSIPTARTLSTMLSILIRSERHMLFMWDKFLVLNRSTVIVVRKQGSYGILLQLQFTCLQFFQD